MPRGGARPGAGRPRKPLAEHVLNQTYRADRHGPLPANVVPMPMHSGWHPAPSEVKRLGARARDWLAAILRLYQLDELEGRRLLEALRSLTRIEAMERSVERLGVMVKGDPHPLLAALAREQRVFLTHWTALRLEK